MDPLAEQTMTPYQYVSNNPIMFTDPTGMSPIGGPGGPPVRNLYKVLDYHITGDKGKDVRRDIIRFEEMKENGWETIYSSNINTAAYTLRTTFTDEKFDNIIIESHTSYYSSDIQNSYFLFQSDNNKIDESTLITNNTLRLGVQRSTLSLINNTNSLKEGGILVFNTCNLGMDSRFMDRFNQLIENKFNNILSYWFL